MNSFVGGGAEKVCLNLAKQFHKFGIDSDFVTVYDTKADYEVEDYIHVFSIGVDENFHFIQTLIYIIRKLPKVNEFIAGKEYVLVTAHLQPSEFLASLSKAGNKCLYVIHATPHLVDKNSSRLFRILLKLFLNKRKIVTVSNGLEYELYNDYGIHQGSIDTIYNPCSVIELRSFSKQPSPHNRKYILVMGRLEEEKRPLLALELYYKGQFYSNYDLVYLGKGVLENSLKNQIARYNLQNCVHLVGFQKNQEQWLRNASLLLSCSKWEGFGMNLAEALICGTPVVSSDCPYGPKEIMIDELEDYLIDPIKEQNKSIEVIYSALKAYPEITEKYYHKFDDELIAKKYLNVWEKYFGFGRGN